MSEAEKESAAAIRDETAAPGVDEPSVALLFSAARQQRAVSTSSAASGSKVPLVYIEMLESGDRERIADQIYLVPFVRRYAAFLALDPEEMVTRFVQEVQRADLSAARIAEPIDLGGPDARRLPLWVWVVGLVLAIAVGYGLASKVYSWRVRKAALSHVGGSVAPKPLVPGAAADLQNPPVTRTSPPAVSAANPAEPRTSAPSKRSAVPGSASRNGDSTNSAARR